MADKRYPLIIAFTGPIGSGKTTAAKYLKNKYGFKRISFAWPVKKLAQLLLNLRDEQVFGTTLQKETVDVRYNRSPREILQTLGHEGRSILGADVWVRSAIKDIERKFENGESKVFVIDDLRYHNEAAIVQQYEGIVVQLQPLGHTSGLRNDHPSEKGGITPDQINYRIVNNHREPIIEFEKELDKIIGEII